MPLITEYHTTDLTTSCAKRTQLRHEGKILGVCPSAMYRGNLFHQGAAWFHESGALPDMKNVDLACREELKKERRALTEAANANSGDTMKEVGLLLDMYSRRFASWFGASKFIGCELPVRATIDVDGEPAEFASHIDLLYRDPHGNLCVWDWKTGDTDWEDQYAHRSLQSGMYYWAIARGSVQLKDENGKPGDYIDLAEEPHVSFVEIDNLKPYGKKQKAKNEQGVEVEYQKGDDRPLSSIVREVLVTNPDAILNEFYTRVRMIRAGLFPTNPSSDACRSCESAKWCPTWSHNPEETANV